MKFKGYLMNIHCLDWEQISTINNFYSVISKGLNENQIVGLGMNWKNDTFDYCIGYIDREEIDKTFFENSKSLNDIKYVEIYLPDNGWLTFEGTNIQDIYNNQIDCIYSSYTYELESFCNEKITIKIYI